MKIPEELNTIIKSIYSCPWCGRLCSVRDCSCSILGIYTCQCGKFRLSINWFDVRLKSSVCVDHNGVGLHEIPAKKDWLIKGVFWSPQQAKEYLERMEKLRSFE